MVQFARMARTNAAFPPTSVPPHGSPLPHWVTPVFIATSALLLRVFQLSGRSLYWDDLIIPAYFFTEDVAPGIRSLQLDPPRSTLGTLFSVYDGHLMPASASLQFLVFRISGLGWWLPATVITVATALSLWLWWHVLRHIGDFTIRCAAFTALAFSPFLMTAAGWWSAAVNAYAWQIACAGVLLCVVNGRSWRAALVLLIGLLFTEKSLTIVPVVAVLVLIRRSTVGYNIGHNAKRKNLALAPAAALTLLWAGFFSWRYYAADGNAVGGNTAGGHDSTSVADGTGAAAATGDPAQLLFDAIPQAFTQAIAPGMLGGPWRWSRWHPGPAFTQPDTWMSIAATLLVLGGFAWLLWHAVKAKRLRPLVTALLGSLCYLAVIFVLLVCARASEQTADVLLRNPHYYADWFSATVLFLAASQIPRSGDAEPGSTSEMSIGDKILASASVLFIASASVTTISWRHAWSDDPTGAYLTNLTATFQRNGEFLDQDTPLDILTPVVYPFNRISTITGHHPVSSTEVPQIIDADGVRTAGAVIPLAENVINDPEPLCGMRVTAGQPRWANLNNPLHFGQWTWQFHAAATSPVTVRISAPNGLEDPADTARKAVTLRVGTELTTHYVRINGGGGTLLVEVLGDEGQSVCVGSGSIGPFVSSLTAQQWAKK